MPIAITITQISESTDETLVFGTLAITGNYANGAADPIDWTTVQGVSSKNGRVFTPQALPDFVMLADVQGFNLEYQFGTTLKNGGLRLFSASNTEQGSGAYPAAVVADANIAFMAAFPKQL